MVAAIFGFIGVVVGALITGLKEWLFRASDEKKKGHYLAIRVCTMLDLFLYDCADVVQDDGYCQGQREPDGTLSPQARLPSLSFDAMDVDWQAIPAFLAYDILNLPNRIHRSMRYIEGAAEHAFPPDYEEVFDARQDEFAKLGKAATDIASQLRTFAKLPAREQREWDPMEPIESRLLKVAQREKSTAAFWEDNDI